MKKVDILSEMREEKMDPVAEVQQQLNLLSQEEKNAMRNAGFATTLTSIPSEAMDCKGKVYHIDEIRRMCVKYDMKFLHPKWYKGYVDPLLGSKLVAVSEELRAKHGRFFSNPSYKLLAPRESFSIELVDEDPILFRSINNEYFEVVHKWGKDMTSWRRIIAILRLPFIHSFSLTHGRKGLLRMHVILLTLLVGSALLLSYVSSLIKRCEWMTFSHYWPITVLMGYSLFTFFEIRERKRDFDKTDKK